MFKPTSDGQCSFRFGDLRRRDLLGGDVLDELGITGGAHFGDVQAGDFDFGGHTVAADDLADEVERNAANQEIPPDANDDFDELGQELRGAAAVEQADDAAAGGALEIVQA